MARAGLKKVTKTVRGKRGTVRRTYWVKSAAQKVGGFLNRHKGKIAAGAALAGAGLLASRHRLALRGAYHGAKATHQENRAINAGNARYGKGMGMLQQAKHVLSGARTGAHVGEEMRPQSRGGFRRLRTATRAVAGRNVTAYLAASKALHGYA